MGRLWKFKASEVDESIQKGKAGDFGPAGRGRWRNYMNVPKRFLNAIGGDSGNCVLVVGAGLSKRGVRKGGAGLPDWEQLMNLMIAHLEESARCNKAALTRLRTMMKDDPPRYLDVAEAFAKAHEHDTDGYEQFLRQHLAPGDLVDSELHKVILNIGFRGIVSYNFDMVFERQSDRLDKVVYPSLLEQVGRFRRKGLFVKLHGSIDGPAKQLVLTRTSFERLTADERYVQLMRTIFLGHVVLCAGFSLRDPDFQSILADLKNCWGNEMPLLYALMLDPGETVRDEWYKKGVDILPYSEHGEALDFFRKLGMCEDRRISAPARPSDTARRPRGARPPAGAGEAESRRTLDAEGEELRTLVKDWAKKQKIEEMHAIVSAYLEKYSSLADKEGALFRIAALAPEDHALHVCEHLVEVGTKATLDVVFRIFCDVAKEKSLYQLPPHALHVGLHRWVLHERLWEHSSSDTIMGWLLRKEWGPLGVNVVAVFDKLLAEVLKNSERNGLDDLYAAADDVPNAQEQIREIVFAPDFIRGSRTGWNKDKHIVREIRERMFREKVGNKDLSPQDLIDAAEAADRSMPDSDDIGCITNAVRTLLGRYPHVTFLTTHGSSSAYDPAKARAILDALASLRKPNEQTRVIHEINGWGVFHNRGSHAEFEAESLRSGLLVPLWWRYSSEMRAEYLRHCHKGRPEPVPQWTGQDLLFRDLMGFRYDIDEDFRAAFNQSLTTYETPKDRKEYEGRYEPRVLQEVWRDRELKYEITDDIPPELVRRIVISRIDWKNSQSGEVRWEESWRRAAEMLESDQHLRDYVSAERGTYAIDNLLGSYDPQRRQVTLYRRMIDITAREFGIDKDAVSTVVYTHETVHAFSHVGRDLNGRMWDAYPVVATDCPEEQISTPQEAIAQYYTFKLLDLLGDDRLLKAFMALEKSCSPPYRAWRLTEGYSLEQMRTVLIQYRAGSHDWPPMY
jgi:hypothetical protein